MSAFLLYTHRRFSPLPYEVMPGLMQKAADVMPLTQGIKILKNAVLGLPAENVTCSVAVMLLIAAVCGFTAVKFFRWE